MLQCILQLYVENTVASPWCCSPCYGRSREQRAEKKGPKLSEEPRIRRQLDAFGAGRLVWKSWLEPTRTSQLCSCRSGKPFAWPMSQKGSLVNSEERHETCHSLSSKRLSHFFESTMFMQTCATCTCPMRSTDDGDPQA